MLQTDHLPSGVPYILMGYSESIETETSPLGDIFTQTLSFVRNFSDD